MRFSRLLGLAGAASLAATFACAQTSTAPATAAEEPPAAADPAAPAAKPKPKRPASPQPAQALTVINASPATAISVTITAEDKTAQVSGPLKPQARTAVKLPKIKGCKVAVAASFEGGGQVDIDEFDICKEKQIRFTQ